MPPILVRLVVPPAQEPTPGGKDNASRQGSSAEKAGCWVTKQVPEEQLAPAGAGTVVPTGVVLHGALLYLGPDQAGRSMGEESARPH